MPAYIGCDPEGVPQHGIGATPDTLLKFSTGPVSRNLLVMISVDSYRIAVGWSIYEYRGSIGEWANAELSAPDVLGVEVFFGCRSGAYLA